MSIEVKNTGPANQAQRTQATTAAQQAKGLTGAQALKNSEAMFDLTFMADAGAQMPATLGEPVVADALGTTTVRTQLLGMFGDLKARFLQVRPDGKPSEAFDNQALAGLGQSLEGASLASAHESLSNRMPAGSLPPDVKRSLDKLSDVFFARRLETLAAEQTLAQSPAFDFLKSGPGAAQLQKLKPVLAPIVAKINAALAKEASKETSKEGSANAQSQNVQVGKNGESKQPEDALSFSPELTKQIGKLAQIGKVEAMDVDAMLIMAFMAISEDATMDLQEKLKSMQHTTQLKQVKRDLIREMKKAQGEIKGAAQAQLDELKKSGKVDDGISLEDYMAQCKVQFTPPQVNEQSMDVQFTPPTLIPPETLPASWAPVKDPAGKDLKLTLGNSITEVSKMKKISDALNKNAPMQVVSNKMIFEMAGNASAGGSSGAGEAGPTIMSASDFDNEVQKQQDSLDALSSQSEIDQLQMQMYMDRRQKAIETLSDAQKKISDTQEAVIKNLT